MIVFIVIVIINVSIVLVIGIHHKIILLLKGDFSFDLYIIAYEHVTQTLYLKFHS